MNIVFFCTQFHPQVGGTEYVAEAWARRLVSFGHQLTVITDSKNIEPDSFPFFIKRRASILKRWVSYKKADVVVSFNVSLKEIPIMLLAKANLVFSHHTAIYKTDGSPTRFASLKKLIFTKVVHKNIACSRFLASSISSTTKIIPNPYRETIFNLSNGHITKRPQILFVGRLVSDKGCLILLKAFKILVDSGYHFNLCIIGNGPIEHTLVNYSQKNCLTNKVVFLGTKEPKDVAQVIRESQITVIPSICEEAFGLVAIEAIACGCKVIASNIGGLPEAVGNCGELFEPGNYIELANKIKMIYSANSGNLQDMEQVNQHLERHTEQNSASALEQALKTFL